MSSLTFSDSFGLALCPISPSTGIASEGGVNGNQRLVEFAVRGVSQEFAFAFRVLN